MGQEYLCTADDSNHKGHSCRVNWKRQSKRTGDVVAWCCDCRLYFVAPGEAFEVMGKVTMGGRGADEAAG